MLASQLRLLIWRNGKDLFPDMLTPNHLTGPLRHCSISPAARQSLSSAWCADVAVSRYTRFANLHSACHRDSSALWTQVCQRVLVSDSNTSANVRLTRVCFVVAPAQELSITDQQTSPVLDIDLRCSPRATHRHYSNSATQ